MNPGFGDSAKIQFGKAWIYVGASKLLQSANHEKALHPIPNPDLQRRILLPKANVLVEMPAPGSNAWDFLGLRHNRLLSGAAKSQTCTFFGRADSN